MLNYDFYKFQIYIKHLLINSLKVEYKKIQNYFETLEYTNLLLKKYFEINKNINYEISNDRIKELKNIIKILYSYNEKILLQKSFTFNIENIKYHVIFNFFDEIENIKEEDKIICFSEGILSNVKKIDYTFFPIGLFNIKIYLTEEILDKFKNCINIGYNTNIDKDYIGFHKGVPLYNSFYSIYDNYIDEEGNYFIENKNLIKKEFEKNIFFTLKKILLIKENFNILNIIPIKEIKENLIYDNNKYYIFQNMLNEIIKILTKEELNQLNSIKILNQNNNNLVIEKNINLLKFIKKYENIFYNSLNKIVDETNKNIKIYENDFKKINFYIKDLKFLFELKEDKKLNIHLDIKDLSNLELIKKYIELNKQENKNLIKEIDNSKR